MEPAPSRDPEALRDFPVPGHPCPPLHPGSKSSCHLLCNIFSPGLGDSGQWQPADWCGWGWLALALLWEPPENSSVLGDPALLASLQAEPQLACLGRMLPWTAGGLSPKKPIASLPAAEDVLSPVPGLGQGLHHLLTAGRRKQLCKAVSCSGLGLATVVLLFPPLCPASLPWEPRPPCWIAVAAVSWHPGAGRMVLG